MRSGNKFKSLKYLLIATSSLIGLNSNITTYGADRLTAPNNNREDNRFQQISYTAMANDWENNAPQHGDNMILLANGSIGFNTDVNIGTINLYGNMGDTIYVAPGRDIRIGNIVNDINQNAINAVTVANQNVLLNPGMDLNPTIDLVLQSQGIVLNALAQGNAGGGLVNSKLTITGNDISAVRSIDVRGSVLKFESATAIDAKVFGGRAGRIIADHNLTFNNVIGKNNQDQISGIGLMQIRDNKTVTLKNDLYGGGVADVIFDSAQARIVIDPSNRNIQISSTFNTTVGEKDDDLGIIEIKGHQNYSVNFTQDVGGEDNRISKITIAPGKETQFQNLVFAKKIEIDQNLVLFDEDVDMIKRQEPVLILQQRAQQQVIVMQTQAIMAQRQAAINQRRQIVENQIRQRDGVLANVDLNQL
ncbi:hypothetical protein Trichorick_00698 [Candidatus Trichorickettsia mobilis]|uniref:Uncharacterized protein n=1 Tax=Candidatus Trichorickettsia mobilis TaxID=1346319 RepID=A0ABZ0US03_9RICK|nr:hypothetical protein [Candidatus Trichorickettsia mobilis]WPY00810.1 hypothetical protein Trichorick_00698 [Candidatus Trichorickettsia mobilis]